MAAVSSPSPAKSPNACFSSSVRGRRLPLGLEKLRMSPAGIRSPPSISCAMTKEEAAATTVGEVATVKLRPDSFGRFGKFGGKYVPETLMHALTELEEAFHSLAKDEYFQKELDGILKDYVGRESPLYFAEQLTDHYKRSNGEGPLIYLKREDLNHTGAHKINNAVAQALLAKRLGKKRIIAETGAGQHGVATATVCARFGLQCIIYMGAQDMERQALNVFRMRLLGAEVKGVHSGTATLKDATSEAIRDWVTNVETTHYILGSVAGPHPYPMMVRDFHAVIGKETRRQAMEKWGGKPDILVACVGGGSNAMGLFHEFVDDNDVRLIGVEAAMITHAPWNGCNLADFVMPFFLFIVGMAIPLSLKRIPSRLLAVKRVMVRTLKLLFWGILLQGGYSHAPDKLSYGVDMKHIRWCGILQRIALAYTLVSLLEIFTKNAKVDTQPPVHLSIFKLYCWQWLFGICILVIYLVVIYATYVPDWEFTIHNTDSQDYGKAFTVICGARGRLDPPCNVVGYIDRVVLGINHLYQRPAWKRSKVCTYDSPYDGPLRKDAPSWCQAPFEPEGILSSISAILSTIIGVHFGHVLVHMKNHLDRLKQWVVMGIALLVLGILLHFTHAIPLNKQLYSFSYVCVTAGAAAIVFSMFYFLVDVVGLRYFFLPLEWIGMNAMLVYVMAAAGIFEGFFNGWYYESPNNTLVYWIKKHIFIKVWHSRRVGVLLYVIFAEILFWALVAGVLQRLGIYWKL